MSIQTPIIEKSPNLPCVGKFANLLCMVGYESARFPQKCVLYRQFQGKFAPNICFNILYHVAFITITKDFKLTYNCDIKPQNDLKVAKSAAFYTFFATQSATSCQFEHAKMEAKQCLKTI